MKRSKITLALLAIVFAVGSAFTSSNLVPDGWHFFNGDVLAQDRASISPESELIDEEVLPEAPLGSCPDEAKVCAVNIQGGQIVDYLYKQ
jgi:hypothetical protein